MRNNIVLFLLGLLFCIGQDCHAVEAYPYVVDFRQPDGTYVKARMRGNEDLKWAETEDGYTLVYDDKGYLVFATQGAEGDLVPTVYKARSWSDGKALLPEVLKNLKKGLTFSERQINIMQQASRARMQQMALAGAATAKTPVVGTRRMLLLLVEYQDVKFQHTQEDFDMLMNQLYYFENGNFGSVRDFYLENSFGKLDLVTAVAGVYTLPHERAYYGGNTDSSRDVNCRQMALDAVALADADIDFSEYDNDGDGVLDGVHIIYAGPGEEAGGGADCIWAHYSTLYGSRDGVKMGRYSCSPEIRGSGGKEMTYIGVICHEIGHVLGCKDFYDTNYSYGGQYQGLGRWDLMSSGNWNGGGARPAHFNPYVKIYDYGWGVAMDGNKAATITLKAKTEDGFVRIDTETEGEYFLLEYRSQSGFDTAIPGHGLMVYHASDNLSGSAGNVINAYHKQQFYPVCANAPEAVPNSESSSYGTVNAASAPFPGTLGRTELTDFTVPAMLSWNSVPTNYPLTEIHEDVQGGSVTFDIDGGSEGGAYNFRISDSDEQSISLVWENPNEEEVMLVCSEEVEMGMPGQKDYQVGDMLDAGGLVVYMGVDKAFVHQGLEAGVPLYYKLFTHKQDGHWTAGRTAYGKTEVGIIRKFPYSEDFETGFLDKSWKQDSLFANTEWRVDYFRETTDRKLQFILNNGKTQEEDYWEYRQTTRLESPLVDFTGKKCALLSFDCLNTLLPTKVLYRTTPTSEWKDLAVVGSDYDADKRLEASLGHENRHYYVLPDLTPSYQFAFVADYLMPGNVISKQKTTTLDNILIETDYGVKVMTNACSSVGSDYARTIIKVFEGLDKIAEKGVEWSFDNVNWERCISMENDTVTLEGLPLGTAVFYRAYAVEESGEVVTGEVLSFTTLSFSRGKGTCEDPYLIGSDEEWANFFNFIEAGNDCSGQYYALSQSFELKTVNTNPSGVFSGTLDGRGHTLDVRDGNFLTLFYMIGREGVVTNLKVNFEDITIIGALNAGICSHNRGSITHCDVCCARVRQKQENYCFRFAGICCKNKGTIAFCHADINAMVEDAYLGRWDFGGICGSNFSLITDCSFDGNAQCNNNSHLGGIVHTNWYGEDENCTFASGIIRNCINRGHFEVVPIVGERNAEYNNVGGIAGTSCGLIDQCINKGELVNCSSSSGWSCSMGGISGRLSYGTISNCCNRGKMTALEPYDEQQVGGIVGYDDRGSILNCVDLNPFTLTSAQPVEINAIVGSSEDAEIANNYYVGEVSDQYATKCSMDTLTNLAGHLNASLQEKLWIAEGESLKLDWESTGIKMAMGAVTDVTSNHASFKYTVSGDNLQECGVEWRQDGQDDWTRVPSESNRVQRLSLEGLSPATCYVARLYGINADGTERFSEPERFATFFDSDGNADDPHLINGYKELLAFNEMIAHGREFPEETIRLMADVDLKGNQNVLWTPMQGKYYHDATFRGEFDGNGKIVRNMKIDTGKRFAGFFATSCGYIHDLQIWDADIRTGVMPSFRNLAINLGSGVGGVCGAKKWECPYPYMFERCGFRGRIYGYGGYAMGGIVGNAPSGETGKTAKDCYAIADLSYSGVGQCYMGGIAGKGNVCDSYFVGTLGKPLFPITSNTPTNCYYNTQKKYAGTDFGTYMTRERMQEDNFLSRLTEGVWVRADHVNEGFPVFAGMTKPRVETVEAQHNERGDVILTALFTEGTEKDFQTLGFQWYSLADGSITVFDVVSEEVSPIYHVTLPNVSVPDEGMVWRAFIQQDNDTIYGEWKMFVPELRAPSLVVSQVVYDAGMVLADFRIDSGSFELAACRFCYKVQNNDSSLTETDIEPMDQSLEIKNLHFGATYECWLKCTTTTGQDFEGQHLLFDLQIATGTEPVVLHIGNSNVYTVGGQKISGNSDRIDSLPDGIYLFDGKTMMLRNQNR